MNKDQELHKLDVLNEKQRKHINMLEMQKDIAERRFDALKRQYNILMENYMCAIKKLSEDRLSAECENYKQSEGIDRILTDVRECQIINKSKGCVIDFKEFGIRW